MEKIKIIKYYCSDKNKNGVPYVVKNGPTKGSKYKRVAIQVSGGDVPENTWLSKNAYRDDDPALLLKEGDSVEIKIWQDGDFWNFDFPKPEDKLTEDFKLLQRQYEDLDRRITELEQGRGASMGAAIKEMKKEDLSDLPF